MAIAPVDMDSLKAEDIVIKSTPQQRSAPVEKETPKETPKEVPKETPKETPKADAPKPNDKKDSLPPIPGEEKETPSKETPKDEALKAEESDFDWEAFSENVGIELDSDDAVIDSLKELAEYKSLSPALQKAIEIERNKGDVAAYFKAIATDPKTLSERDALWEQYVADNPKRVSGNMKFARLDFERKIEKEYSLLNEYEKLPADEQEEFLSEHKAELEYLKEKRAFDAEAARASLQELRDKTKFYDTKEPDESKIKQIMETHEKGYKKALSEFDVVTLDIGKDFQFNVGLSDANKKQATEWMRSPDKFLNELGFSDGKVDYDTLAGWVALIADIKYGNFGERLRQALVDNKDINTLEKTLDAPGIGKTPGEKSPILEGDEWDQVGAAFEKKRLESKKR